jgi:hypothetical protein
LKLKSHKKLIGYSQLANGRTLKYDYLAKANINVQGQSKDFVVKIAPLQTNLFGIDLIILFNMSIDIPMLKYTIHSNPVSVKKMGLKLLDFDELLKMLDLSDADLMDIEDLPDPEKAYKDAIASGTSYAILNLGFSGFAVAK